MVYKASCIYSLRRYYEKDKKYRKTFYKESFYRYMVRNLVGTLISVGEGKITPSQIEEMLNGKKYQYQTVPANGLYLTNIEY